MRQTCFLFAACILLGMAGPVLAQSKPDSSTTAPAPATPAPSTTTPAAPEPAKAAPAKAAKPASQPGVPAEEMKKLEMLKGTWNSKVTMNEGSGAPGSATGKAQYAWAFNGMHLEGDHSYTIGGKPMKGRTTWGWDAEKQQYQLLWVNSMDSAAKTYYGTFPSESSLSFFTTYMADGKAVTEKITFTFADPNSYVFKVENDGSGTMATVMEETATRGAANAKSSTAKKPASKPATASTKKKTG
jgi:Protein of unknown function (DUF1579)